MNTGNLSRTEKRNLQITKRMKLPFEAKLTLPSELKQEYIKFNSKAGEYGSPTVKFVKVAANKLECSVSQVTRLCQIMSLNTVKGTIDDPNFTAHLNIFWNEGRSTAWVRDFVIEKYRQNGIPQTKEQIRKLYGRLASRKRKHLGQDEGHPNTTSTIPGMVYHMPRSSFIKGPSQHIKKSKGEHLTHRANQCLSAYSKLMRVTEIQGRRHFSADQFNSFTAESLFRKRFKPKRRARNIARG